MRNNIRYKILILVTILFLFSCKDFYLESCPNYFFSEPFPKRTIDFTRILGHNITLERKSISELMPYIDSVNNILTYIDSFIIDTINLSIKYNKTSKFNTIVNTTENDTLFNGMVSIYRNYYFLSEKKNDSNFWIGAMIINQETIQGLIKTKEQMCDLEFLLRLNPEYKSMLTKDTLEENYKLDTNKKNLRKVYSKIVERYPVNRIIASEDENPINANFYSEIQTIEPDIITEESNVESIFPNPASEKIVIDLSRIEKTDVEIFNNLGKIIFSDSFENSCIEISLSNTQSGLYYIKIKFKDLNKTETYKLLIN